MSGVVAGCGIPTGQSVNQKIQTHAQQLDEKNYQSEAMMTVQMDDNNQTYYVKVSYESPEVYKIELGNQDKQIHQIIVHNQNGMFIVSPSLGKVFRFNGNWAQNQGQIYLYDQLLKQISSKDVKMTRSGGTYQFTVPVTPASDTISSQQVVLNKDLNPTSVSLLDKDGKAAVSLKYTSFKTGVQFQANAFNPQSMVTDKETAKTTMTGDEQSFGSIEAKAMYGAKLTSSKQMSETSALLRYTGAHNYLLQEWRPTQGASATPDGQLVNMYGVPAMYSGNDQVGSLTWIDNGVEFSLTSNDLNLDQLENVALSTLGQIGK
jgi:outer membrane lipoprotein-sorting protein